MKPPGKDTTVIHFVDTLRAFVAKIKNWTSKVSSGNFAMFEKFSEVTDGKEETDSCLQNEESVTLKICTKNFPDTFLILKW